MIAGIVMGIAGLIKMKLKTKKGEFKPSLLDNILLIGGGLLTGLPLGLIFGYILFSLK